MEIIVALIACVAALVTGLLSWLSSRRLIKAEVEKLRVGFRQEYLGRLQEQRISAYPRAYEVVSGFIKRLHEGEPGKAEFDELGRSLDEWDTQNALFLGTRATECAAALRNLITQLRFKDEQGLIEHLSQESLRSQLFESLQLFELALKIDLGIPAVDVLAGDRRWESYAEVEAAIREVQRKHR